jgi:hypothetical protein
MNPTVVDLSDIMIVLTMKLDRMKGLGEPFC